MIFDKPVNLEIEIVRQTALAAQRGETHNTGTFTLPAGAQEYELHDPRMGAEKSVFLTPLDATAAGLRWWIEESSIAKGAVMIKFLGSAEDDCRFDYMICGVKRFRA
jgi:hypothetical protein